MHSLCVLMGNTCMCTHAAQDCGPQQDGGEATNVTLSLDGTDGVLIGRTN